MKHLTNLVTLGVAAAASLGMSVGCSTPQSGETTNPNATTNARSPIESAKLESAITSMCRLSTVGLPCDPDGAGAATECEGLCWVDDAALVSCRPLADLNMTIIDLNGRICGDVEGNNCGQSCENGQCVDKNARLGTACRPANNSSTCDGVCTLSNGEPTCDDFTVCGRVGISEDGCALTACNFDAFEDGCKVFELDNPVCDASNQPPIIDAGSTDDGDTATGESARDAAADAALVTTDNDSTTSRDSDSTTFRDTNSNALDAGSNAGDAGDAGRPPVANRAVKVVGGACSTSRQSSDGSLSWLALAALAVVGRRKRCRN